MNPSNEQKNNSALTPKTKIQKKPQRNQVSLAGVANTPEKKETKPKKAKKRRFPWRLVVVAILLIFLIVIGIVLYDLVRDIWNNTQKKGKSMTGREQRDQFSEMYAPDAGIQYTPDAMAADVSYYLMGVTGTNIGDPMDMLAVMCFDRKANAVSLVQIPVDTYIDKESGFAVDTIGNVWHNPQPLIFCSACREQVPLQDQDGEVHATCGAKLEERKGSPHGDLIRIVNEQYGLPVDNYFILPRAGLVQLIDSLKGIKVEMNGDVTLGERVYESGVNTLDGQAAVEYAFVYNYKGNATSDRERMARQRQVLAAVWNQIAACTEKDLYYENELGQVKGILGKLMFGANPIRYDDTSFGKARMLGITDKEAEGIEDYDALCRFLMMLGDVTLDKVTCSILPGETETMGTTKVYSVNRAQTVQLLNEQMNPYELTIDESTVTAPQVTEVAQEVDFATVTLDTVLPVVQETPEQTPEKGEE